MYLGDVESCAQQAQFLFVGTSDPIFPFHIHFCLVFIRHDYNDGVRIEQCPTRLVFHVELISTVTQKIQFGYFQLIQFVVPVFVNEDKLCLFVERIPERV